MSKAIIDEALVEAGIEPTKARAATNAVLEKIVDELIENGRFTLTSIGTLKLRHLPKRKRMNPKTGEMINCKAHYTVGFRVSNRIKETIV